MSTKIINGDILDVLKDLNDESVDCVITSPPYYGLRSYDGAKTIWGGDVNCNHEFNKNVESFVNLGFSKESPKFTNDGRLNDAEKNESAFCSKCGAWKGQLGLEPSYKLYIEHLMMVTKELKRILKKTGNLFWNIGDSSASSGGPSRHRGYPDPKWRGRAGNFDEPTAYDQGIKPKSLMMIPERFAMAMIDDGWMLRNKIIWHKPNGVPDSSKDRLTRKWEYVFFFTKSKKYYFDLDSIRKPLKLESIKRKEYQMAPINWQDRHKSSGIRVLMPNSYNSERKVYKSKYLLDKKANTSSPVGRVMRNLDDGKTETFVRKALTDVNQYLKNKLNESGLKIEDIAEISGEPLTSIAHYFRTDESGSSLPSKKFWNDIKDKLDLDDYELYIKEEYKSVMLDDSKGANPGDAIECEDDNDIFNDPDVMDAFLDFVERERPELLMNNYLDIATSSHLFEHFAVYPEKLIMPLIKAGCPKDGIVLDPFAGSGTTGVVADILGRNSILIEISEEYSKIIKERFEPENILKEKEKLIPENERIGEKIVNINSFLESEDGN